MGIFLWNEPRLPENSRGPAGLFFASSINLLRADPEICHGISSRRPMESSTGSTRHPRNVIHFWDDSASNRVLTWRGRGLAVD